MKKRWLTAPFLIKMGPAQAGRLVSERAAMDAGDRGQSYRRVGGSPDATGAAIARDNHPDQDDFRPMTAYNPLKQPARDFH
ncbi:MAG: hypothetical protein J0H09_19440 [Burkholderiales bacterium]|nr:hypothetical protein [Burkholderiales bacterium]